jgi:Protein of unknown function (DUF3093)
MPPSPASYVERLSVRARWWAVVLAVAVGGSTELFAGFAWPVVVIVLATVLVPTVVLLFAMGHTTVRVDAVGLHAGKHTVTYDEMDSVQALDQRETRLQIGPASDPAGVHVVRGFVPTSVLVRPREPGPVPYWLVSTRHPQDVIAAIEAEVTTRSR